MINRRYGPVANLADFVRKAQLANYEAYRAMYEGRNAKLFKPCTGVITWMSNPAQPSFVWQLYHHDLEPNASLFAVRKACEPIHVQLNEKEGNLEVVNNLPSTLSQAVAQIKIYNLDSSLVYQHEFALTAKPTQTTDLGPVAWPASLSSVHFVKLQLRDHGGQVVSENFYWRGLPEHPDNLQDLNNLPVAKLEARVKRHDAAGKCLLEVSLSNPGPTVALMAHLQLRRQKTNLRVLPVYYSDNYVSLTPKETKTITIEAAQSDLGGEPPVVLLDGWNVGLAAASSASGMVALNRDAQVANWSATGLAINHGPRLSQMKINCGGPALEGFVADTEFNGGNAYASGEKVDANVAGSVPTGIYESERWGDCTYSIPVKPLPDGHTYTVRLHFVETKFKAAGLRRFNVELNGSRILTDLDIVQEAGGSGKFLVKEFTGISPDEEGELVIRFIRGSADQPKINAIEISDTGFVNAAKKEGDR
jgi:hypothetical protein